MYKKYFLTIIFAFVAALGANSDNTADAKLHYNLVDNNVIIKALDPKISEEEAGEVVLQDAARRAYSSFNQALGWTYLGMGLAFVGVIGSIRLPTYIQQPARDFTVLLFFVSCFYGAHKAGKFNGTTKQLSKKYKEVMATRQYMRENGIKFEIKDTKLDSVNKQ